MGLIGAVVGGIASAVGGIAAANAQNKGYKKQQQIYEQRMNDVRAHRDNLYYRDPTQSAENQAAVTEAKEMLAEQAKRAAASAAVAGGTDESVAMAKKQGADAVGKMMQQQAAQGERQKEAVWNNADQQLDAFSQYLAESKLQQAKGKAQAIAGAAGGLSNAAGSLPI